MNKSTDWLASFVAESNAIEGITRDSRFAEIKVTEEFIALDKITVEDIENFVSVIAPGNILRDKEGLNVRVGNHYPPKGGMYIRGQLGNIIFRANALEDPYKIHHEFETLHAFSDGNGRSGRALWLWQMLRGPQPHWPRQLGFLRAWYYQSLEHGDSRNV